MFYKPQQYASLELAPHSGTSGPPQKGSRRNERVRASEKKWGVKPQSTPCDQGELPHLLSCLQSGPMEINPSTRNQRVRLNSQLKCKTSQNQYYWTLTWFSRLNFQKLCYNLLLESDGTQESIVYVSLNASSQSVSLIAIKRMGQESKRKKTVQERKKCKKKGMGEKKIRNFPLG